MSPALKQSRARRQADLLDSNGPAVRLNFPSLDPELELLLREGEQLALDEAETNARLQTLLAAKAKKEAEDEMAERVAAVARANDEKNRRMAADLERRKAALAQVSADANRLQAELIEKRRADLEVVKTNADRLQAEQQQ